MNQEEIDFQIFKENNLESVDFNTGKINTYYYIRGTKRIVKDVGSLNRDGYIRIWCNKKLRMKHRLLYWLYYGVLPKEIDHIDSNRRNNSITNLRSVNRSENTSNKTKRTYKQLKEEDVHQICQMLVNGDSITDIANKFNRSRCQIKAIKTKKYWKTVSDYYF